MYKSESIAELAKALSKAQSEIKGAIMDSANPFFKSKYADLSSVWDACRKPLTDNGLAVIQTGVMAPEYPDKVCIETTLIHSSGEWWTGIMSAKPVKDDPQAIGSCVTYLRRYSLSALVGICPEDDDGNAATQPANSKEPPKKANEPPKQPPETAKSVDDDKQKEMQKEIGGWLCEIYGGILGAEEQLEALTKWKNKEGKEIPGKKSVFDLATKPNAKGQTQTSVIHNQIKKKYEEWKTTEAADGLHE
jgi:hypothetical protein